LILQGSSNGFSSSRTSRITFVDLVGPENDELNGAASIPQRRKDILRSLFQGLGMPNCNCFFDDIFWLSTWFSYAKSPRSLLIISFIFLVNNGAHLMTYTWVWP